MNDEPILFDPDIHKQSRTSDPFTSHEAAQKAVPRMGSEKSIVLEIFQTYYPLNFICDEVEQLAQIAGAWPGNASKRVSDLARDGYIEWTGKTRLTRANKQAKEWRLKQ